MLRGITLAMPDERMLAVMVAFEMATTRSGMV